MIHFLVKREDERAQENQELKDMVKELRDTHKQDGILVDVDRYKMELRAEIEKEKKLRVAAEDKIAILEAKTKNMNYG
jgi:hypothetical protein